MWRPERSYWSDWRSSVPPCQGLFHGDAEGDLLIAAALSGPGLDAVAGARIQPDLTKTGGRGIGSWLVRGGVASRFGPGSPISQATPVQGDRGEDREGDHDAAAMPIPEGIDAHDRQAHRGALSAEILLPPTPGRCRSCRHELAEQVQQSLVVALDVVAVGFFRHAGEVRPLDQGGLVEEQLASLRDARLYEDLG